MWVKLCAPSRGDHILRLVAPWRLHAMACPYISTPAAAPESCSIVAPWRLHPMACPHVARFVGTLLDQCVYIMQKTYISYDTGSADAVLNRSPQRRSYPAAGAPINHGDDILWFLAASPSESHPLLLCLLLCLLFCLLLCFLFYGRRMEK